MPPDREPAPPGRRRSLNVCMVTHSFYESDNRVRRYAEVLAGRGDRVTVLALRREPGLPDVETIRRVRVERIQDRFRKNERSKLAHVLPILRFLIVASARLRRETSTAAFDLVHVHNLPDFLVFAAWYPKVKGARIILDIHDILPEFYANKFGVADRSLLTRALRVAERVSARMADHVILANDLWRPRYVARTHCEDRCSVFINHVDTTIFGPGEHSRRSPAPIIIFPGGLQQHQGLDIALRAFAMLRVRLPTAQLHIYGDGPAKEGLVELAGQLDCRDCVKFLPPVSIDDIAKVMSRADLGIVPKRADSFGNEAYSTKIMEFMAVGVPVVASSTTIDRYYFNDRVVRFFPSGDAVAMADAMHEVLTDETLRTSLVTAAMEYVERNNWDHSRERYLAVVDQLCTGIAATRESGVSDVRGS